MKYAKDPETMRRQAADFQWAGLYELLYYAFGGLGGASPSAMLPVGDAGPAWTPVRTHTTSADMTTPSAICPAPTSGGKLIGDDFLISADTTMSVSIIEETSGTVFAKVYLAANSTAQITLRDGLKTATVDKRFFAVASVAGNVDITACTHSV